MQRCPFSASWQTILLRYLSHKTLLTLCALAQHNALVGRMDQLEAEAGEDVRVLARMWQLQNKMESVGSGASYGGPSASSFCFDADQSWQCPCWHCAEGKQTCVLLRRVHQSGLSVASQMYPLDRDGIL